MASSFARAFHTFLLPVAVVAGASCTAEVDSGASSTQVSIGALTSWPTTLSVGLELDGRPVRLELWKAPVPLSGGYDVRRLSASGALTQASSDTPDCFYEGNVYEEGSDDRIVGAFAAISICTPSNGPSSELATDLSLRGVIHLQDRAWAIEPIEKAASTTGEHRVSLLSDLRAQDKFGSASESTTTVQRYLPDAPQVLPFREGTAAETKYIELFVTNDSRRVAQFGSASLAEADTVALVTAANTIFSNTGLTPRVRLALVGQLTYQADPYDVPLDAGEADSAELLGRFNSWGVSVGDMLPAHDLRLLLSGYDFDGATVGAAHFEGICWPAFQSAAAQTTSNLSTLPSETIVHELGHTLGMVHDGEMNACAAQGFVMSAIAEPGGLTYPSFSECSQDEFAAFLGAPNGPDCLNDMPSHVSAEVCGDGVVSGNEECDCGARDCTDIDPCCDGAECRLAAGAECSSYNDPTTCCVECRMARAEDNAVCRPARDECDVPEVCLGFSLECPGDTWPRGGGPCETAFGDQGTCFAGACQSRAPQCRTLGRHEGFTLDEPSPECLASKDPCLRPVCEEPGTGLCYELPGAPPDGVACGKGAQCQGGHCIDSDALDECPADPLKTTPGLCGCGVPDVDSDGDGTPDCHDGCPLDPLEVSGCDEHYGDYPPYCPAVCLGNEVGCNCDLGEGCSGKDCRESDSSASDTDASGGCACSLRPSSKPSPLPWLAALPVV